MELSQALRAFSPNCEQERADVATILRALAVFDDLFSRENTLAHLTASAWVSNAQRTHVLMAYHNLYNAWAWTGGHADGDCDLLKVALREAVEETGASELQALSNEIFSLEVLPVEGHFKRGLWVAPHLHLNITYALQASDTAPLRAKLDENSAVQWMSLSDAVTRCSEASMRVIYQKLNEKLLHL